MPQINPSPVTPKPTPLPPLAEQDPLTPGQWRVLLAFADTIIASITSEASEESHTELGVSENAYSQALTTIAKQCGGDKDVARQYLAERPSENPLFKELCYRLLSVDLPSDLRSQLSLGLNVLDYRAGALILTGYPKSFADHPLGVRQRILQSWPTGYLPVTRLLFRSISMLVKQQWVKSSPTLYRVLGFPRTPVHGTPGKSFDYAFVQIPPGAAAEPEVLHTDVVIVGSGCGGGVCARNLAEAGFDVMVVDRATFWPAEHLPMTEAEGFNHLFMNGGGMFSDDSSVALFAGQAWGGGGTVNWSASLQTQGFVRKEWSDAGLPFFTSAEFQTCLDRVYERIGASVDAIEHNPSNQKLLEGARKLGWAAKVVPQNTGGKTHYCGYCALGCGSCEKRGPVVSYLPAAANAGAKFMEGFECEKILFDVDKKTGIKTATGVIGTWQSRDEHGGVSGPRLVKRKVIIKAKRVIVSCGTMQSPLLLKRSGLKNPHIGKHLKLHPVNFIGSVYEEEIRPWEGGILTSVVTEFENQDGHGHGVKIEATSMLPSLWIPALFWQSSLDYKLLVPKAKHMVGHFALLRDIGEGEVYADPVDGRSRFRYTLSKREKQFVLDGMLAVAKINYVAGAKEMFSMIPGTSTFVRSADEECAQKGINCSHFQGWLDELRRRGSPSPETFYASAHQMGSCRMAKNAKLGVVDQKGKVFETEGLYVCDASVFPSASGVNPMVTNMAISEWVSNNLAKDLKADGQRAKL